MKRFAGAGAILDRARSILEEGGGSQQVGALSARVLETSSEAIATRVIEPLLRQDPRFRIRAGRDSWYPDRH